MILAAAGRGVCFEMVINAYSPAVAEFQALFAPIKQAQVEAREGVRLSLQGLSEKEVVLAFPGMENYTAVVIRDAYFVELVRRWFV